MREKQAIYEETRRAIVELVAGLEDPASVEVPACPGWSVHDVVAHLSGSCADIMAGNLTGLASDEWTQAQVEARRERPFAEVLAEWNELAPQIAAMVDDFPGRYPDQAISDLTAHEHDIRHAIGKPGRRKSTSVDVALDFVLSMIVHPGMSASSLGPLAVKTDAGEWVVGGGEAEGDFDLSAMRQLVGVGGAHENAAEPVGSVSGSRFELNRAFTGRRSADEVRKLDWSVDPEPYVPAFSLGPFSLRESDLDE